VSFHDWEEFTKMRIERGLSQRQRSMKVVITNSASESLWPIYLYRFDYSQDYAEAFRYEIIRQSGSLLRGNLQPMAMPNSQAA